MPFLTYYERPHPPSRVGQRPKVRREFGPILFASTGWNPVGSTYRVDRELDCYSTYAVPWNSSGTAPTFGYNEFGPCLKMAGTGASGVVGWGGYAQGTAGFLPSGTGRLTVVVAGRATGNLAYNARNFYTASGDGSSLDVGQFSGTSFLIFAARPSQYGSIMSHTWTTASGELSSGVFSWRGGSSYSAFRNGIAGGTFANGTTTLLNPPNHASINTSATYCVGLEINLAIVSANPIPAGLAQDISFDPWLAFEPTRKAFYYSPIGAAAPTWPGGSTVDLTNIGHTSMDVAWDEASDDVAVTQYRYRVNSGSWTNTGLTRTTTLTGLTPGVEYAIDVQAGDVDNTWSVSLSNSATTDEIGIQPVITNPDGDTARANVTGINVLVLGEAPGSTATPTVLAYSATESTDGSGVLDIRLNDSGLDPADIVWLVAVKSDGVPANSGWSVCWPQAVVAI